MTCFCNHLPANANLADSDILNDISPTTDTSDYVLMARRTESSRPSSDDFTPRSLSKIQTQSIEQPQASTSPSKPSSSDSTPRSLSGVQFQPSGLTAQTLAKAPSSPSPLESYVSNEEDSELIVLGLHIRRAERPVLDPVMLQILESL
jgi:cell division septation protein DedD